MRAQEFITETVNPEIDSDEYTLPSKNVRMGDFVFNARTYTGSIQHGQNARGLQIRAYDPKRKDAGSIGSADFIVVRRGGKTWLESDDTEVDEQYRGQGIAAMMYAFAKMLGNDIKDSPYMSMAGANMWDKWGKDAKHLVGEQDLEEEQLDELSFLGSECTKDCSGHRAGYDWSKRKGLRQANSWSPSFNKGAGLAVAGK